MTGFTGDAITIAGIAKIELPVKTLLLCDGGMVLWNRSNGLESYFESDPDWGHIASLDLQRDGVGDVAPGGVLMFAPENGSVGVAMLNPSFQNSRMRFWLAEVNPATGYVIGQPEALFDGLLSNVTMESGRGVRKLMIPFVSRAERFFSNNQGNTCSHRFHASVWPGEMGLVNATGVQTTRAFGIEGPPRGASDGISGVSGGGGGFSGFLERNFKLV